MNIEIYSQSEAFFQSSETLPEAGLCSFASLRGRALSMGAFFEKLIIIPFAFAFKLYRTFFRILGVFASAALLILTLCSVQSIREFFVRRVSFLAKDLADWVLWPVAVVSCLGRLLLAAFVHPLFYFGV
jgi:hypothetical protein